MPTAPWSTRCWPIAAPSLSGIGGVLRPGIVHRLDREVSGVMVAAKHDRAHIGLAGQFSVHSIDRVYEAVVWGVPGAAAGTRRPAARPPPGRPQADGHRAPGRQAGGDPLAAAGGGRHPRRADGVPAGDRAAPTRSACTRRAWATRSSATGSTAAAGRRLPRRQPPSVPWTGSCCMRAGSASSTRSPVRRSRSTSAPPASFEADS